MFKKDKSSNEDERSNMRDKLYKDAPFRDDIVEGDFPSNTLEKFRDDPSKVVRKLPLKTFEYIPKMLEALEVIGDDQVLQGSKEEKLKATIEATRRARNLLFEFGEMDSINLPNTEVVVGEFRGSPAHYVITDKVDGWPLNRTGEELEDASDEKRPEFIENLNNLLLNLTAYMEEKASGGEPYLMDIVKLDQYVYGEDEASGKGKFYFVDTDLHYVGRGSEDIAKTLYGFSHFVINLENRTDHTFNEVRGKILEILDSMLEQYSEPEIQKRIRRARKKLLYKDTSQ